MIREAAPNDLNEILQLYLYLHETSVPEDSGQLRDTWDSIMKDKNHHLIVCEVDGKIVASCVCVIIPNLTRNVRSYAFIENVVTHGEYRGRGYATACLNYARQIAQENHCYKMMLLTGSKEESTLNFYRNAGYNSSDKGRKEIMNINDVITDPNKLVRLELINEGFDPDKIIIPQRVYLLADSFFDEMILRQCGTYKYPLGGELYVFDKNENVGFIKGHMGSPAIATQAEDLIAGGVKELIHIGFAGGLQINQKPGDLVLTDGAFNDTAVARLYGFDYEKIDSTKILTDELERKLLCKNLNYRRGVHWTTDAGYRETWGQVIEHREKGALCVEMEGVGLFTIANYRKCLASAIYLISDVLVEDDWKLGWGEISLEKSIRALIDMIIDSL